MNQTNVKLIWRNLWKNASISAINIVGLSVSLAICALIVLFLQFEFSFDRSNPNHPDIFRLLTTFKYPNSPERSTAMSSHMMGPYLERESGDIENYLRVVSGYENFLCKAGDRQATIPKSLQVDSSFFSFFPYPLLYGDPNNAFNQLQGILLTRPVSEHLFGEKNPIGETLAYTYSLDAERDSTVFFVVSAVLDDLPTNSHLQFDALTLLDDRQFAGQTPSNSWHGVTANTYFRLRPSSVGAKEIAAGFPELLKKEMPNPEMVGLDLQPLRDIHLGSMGLEYDNNNFQKSDKKYMHILALIALFILLISTINFANLSTVLSMRRVQEVGVRRSMGASGGDVFWHFLGEAMLMSILCGCMAMFWVELLREPFLILLGRDIELPYTFSMFAGFTGVVILLGLVAGIFPATQAARYSPVQAFQRKDAAVSVKRPFVQRLVVAQFMLSGILIIGSIISYQQISYLRYKDLGFQYAQVLEIDLGWNNWARSEGLKKELADIPGVVAVSGSDVSLGTIDGQQGIMVRNETTQAWENFPMSINRAQADFFDLYEMEFVAGRPPTQEGAESEMEFVVNESFVKKVGWKNDPIGQSIFRYGMAEGQTGRVVGVIKDIHHNTLHHQISPICFQASKAARVLSLKFEPTRIKEILAKSQIVWARHIKDRPFTYEFLDEHFGQLYQSETRLGHILLVGTVLSILIACLGLLALSAFIIQQRTKEIGIRKVLGATTAGIVGLLSKDFLKLVGLAFIIASPPAYFLMEKWLQDFACRIDISGWVFISAGLVALGVAFTTVGFQSVKAALANPVKSLRSE